VIPKNDLSMKAFRISHGILSDTTKIPEYIVPIGRENFFVLIKG